MNDSGPLDAESRRLLWRCRRGMKELDVLLERFAHERYPYVTGEQQRAFARLLELSDPDLADCFFGRSQPLDPELARLIGLITAPCR